jgi:hypothetical protein
MAAHAHDRSSDPEARKRAKREAALKVLAELAAR